MVAVVRGPAPEWIDEIVAEAVNTLGFFKPGSEAELTAIFRRIWPGGCSATMLIYGNDTDDMTREEKEAAGIDRSRMPREIWKLLSDKGRTLPQAAVADTTVRIVLAVQKRRQHLNRLPS